MGRRKKAKEVGRTKEDFFIFALLAIFTVVGYVSSLDMLTLNSLVVEDNEVETDSTEIQNLDDLKVFHELKTESDPILEKVTPDHYISLWEKLSR